MKARKEFKSYLAMWVLAVVIFHILLFIFKKEIIGNRLIDQIVTFEGGVQGVKQVFNPVFLKFLYSYIFVMLAFIGQIICTYIFLSQETLKKTFYNYPIFKISLQGLLITIIFALVFLFIPIAPVLCFIIFIITLFITVSRCLMAKTAANMVSAKDENIVLKTQYIKILKDESEMLLDKVKDATEKKELKKLVEVIKYSDPMSIPDLKDIEENIAIEFDKMSEIVNQGKLDDVKKACEKLIDLIKERNIKVKSFK